MSANFRRAGAIALATVWAALAAAQGSAASMPFQGEATAAVPKPDPRPIRTAEPAEATPDPGWGAAGPPCAGRAAAASYGLAMPWGQEDFEAFRAAYLSPDGRKWLEAVMQRARPYLGYIEERLRLYALPEELAFLPVVESEFSPKAVSRSGAAGLWQFMRNSISGYGMRIDDWVDERRDFMKSSDGALRKLADNYSTFGDWNIAIAAYNAGAGALGRAIVAARRDGSDSPDYWELRRRGLLSRETSAYVPKFLAIASILMHAGRSGLATSWDSPKSWEAFPPGKPIDLSLLASAAGLDLGLLRAANPELRYGVTPPTPGYLLKVPSEALPVVKAVLEDPGRALIRYYLHTVRSGDTLSAISRRFGTPISAILQANPGLRPDLIRLGLSIVVPAFKDGPAPEEAAPSKGENLDFSGSYTVAKGDSLWALSLRFNVQPEALAERNGLSITSVIREGMTLRVPILN
ncbi:MAG TPA: LysM peptidoglycan-binding domain-containing protein [Rectinemataceae bacterium]|nr:LysM peptidoglycan-binding domain-containing protein [Rectinemataceae bacterium]